MSPITTTPAGYGWRRTKKGVRLHLVPDGGQTEVFVDATVPALCGYRSGSTAYRGRRAYRPALHWGRAVIPTAHYYPPCQECISRAAKLPIEEAVS